MADKIKKLEDLAEIVQKLKQKGQVIVQCHGVFDLLHPGHIRYFEAATKRDKDVLIVTLTPDEHVNKGPGRPYFNQRLRCESIAALECVDYVAMSEGPTAVEAILKLKPDYYVKGADYKDFKNDLTGAIQKEAEAVKAVGGKYRYVEEEMFSSTELLNAHFGVYAEEAETFLKNFRAKHSEESIIKNLKGLKPLKVLVMGEAIIDEYCYCMAIGKSPKEILISTKFEGQEDYPGGSLAVVNHIAGFCNKVDLVSCLGLRDSKESFIRSSLKQNITPKFFYRADSSTIIKRRYVDPVYLTKMFQICYLNDKEISPILEDEMCAHLEKRLPEYDLTVVTDYGHGMMSKKIIDTLCRKAKFLAVNTQTNSLNYGYNVIYKYPRADYVCLDAPEIRLAARNRDGGIEETIQSVFKKLECKSVAITHGPRGSIGYNGNGRFINVPALSKKIVDRMGAGDAYLSLTAPCVAAGYDLEEIGFIGNAAGALAVGIVGNKSSIEPAPLFKFIQALLR